MTDIGDLVRFGRDDDRECGRGGDSVTDIKRRLCNLYAYLIIWNWCPCAWNGPEWSTRLCGRIDTYLWESGYWGPT